MNKEPTYSVLLPLECHIPTRVHQILSVGLNDFDMIRKSDGAEGMALLK